MKLNSKTWLAANIDCNSANVTHSLYLFKGTALSKTDLRNLLLERDGEYNYLALRGKLQPDVTCLAKLHYGVLNPEYINGIDHMRYGLASLPDEFEVGVEDTATWFIFIQHTTGVKRTEDWEALSTVDIKGAFIGSVGALNSGADMEMVNPTLDLANDFKPGDINWTMSGV